jgi:hypothetical protein
MTNFNRAFKRIVRRSPTQFRESLPKLRHSVQRCSSGEKGQAAPRGVTHRRRRWGKRRSARPIQDTERARHGGSVAGIECKSGFRHYLITHFDGLHSRIRCSKRNLKEATTARAQRCGEVATWWPC